RERRGASRIDAVEFIQQEGAQRWRGGQHAIRADFELLAGQCVVGAGQEPADLAGGGGGWQTAQALAPNQEAGPCPCLVPLGKPTPRGLGRWTVWSPPSRSSCPEGRRRHPTKPGSRS